MPTISDTINAPADAVWKHMTVPELMLPWIGSITSLRAVDGGPLKQGTTLIFEARGSEHQSEVVEFVNGSSYTLRSSQGAVTALYRYALEGDERTSRVSLQINCRATGWFRIVMPLLRQVVWLTDRKQVAALKAAVERAEGERPSTTSARCSSCS